MNCYPFIDFVSFRFLEFIWWFFVQWLSTTQTTSYKQTWEIKVKQARRYLWNNKHKYFYRFIYIWQTDDWRLWHDTKWHLIHDTSTIHPFECDSTFHPERPSEMKSWNRVTWKFNFILAPTIQKPILDLQRWCQRLMPNSANPCHRQLPQRLPRPQKQIR